MIINLDLLRMYRTREGWSQEAFCKMVKMSKQKYSLLEQGKRIFKVTDLKKVIDALQLSKKEKTDLLGNLL